MSSKDNNILDELSQTLEFATQQHSEPPRVKKKNSSTVVSWQCKCEENQKYRDKLNLLRDVSEIWKQCFTRRVGQSSEPVGGIWRMLPDSGI